MPKIKIGLRYVNRAGCVKSPTFSTAGTEWQDTRFPIRAGSQTFTAEGLFDPVAEQRHTPNDLVESLPDRIYRILRNATLEGITYDDDPDLPYQLVDAVSDDDATIDTGERRLRTLADQLSSAIFLDWETARAEHPISEDKTNADQ